MSTPANIYELLDDEGSNNAPVKKQPKAAAAKKEAPAPAAVEAKQPHQRVVTEDRARRGGREGARFGGRGGNRGGRGGRGGAADGSVRQFDRRGAPRRHAPGQAPKGGHALGPQGGDIDADAFAAAEQDAAVNGGENPIVSGGDEAAADAAAAAIEDLGFGVVFEEEDNTVTYDEFLAKQKALAVDEQYNIRQAQNDDSKWKKVTALVKQDDEKKVQEQAPRTGGAKKSGKISLDEFVGDAPRAQSRPASSGFDRPSSAPRGGRGGARGGPRGGARGGASRGGARGGNNIVLDESAFPKLGGK